ncbi:MAG: histone deacetylase family protein [Proteobacteria bacterium]|nr:histone deacetylase family protein [Pseudomonadota bacterium]
MTAVISHPDCTLHQNGTGSHPESAGRLGAINNQLITSGLDCVLSHYDAPKAGKHDLYRVHTREYVEQVFRLAPQQGYTMLDGDTWMNPHTLNAALRSAGAMLKAVDLVMTGKHSQAFCNIRPPGHHAGKSRAAGFCIFNNVAVGAAYALEKYDLQRVAILDFDVHHGNGTEDIFSGDQRILFGSSFQHPFYPYSGADTDVPNIINLPMPAGTSGEIWQQAVAQQWLPRLDEFKPELIIISAGFDSHWKDDMGGFKLLEADYAWFTQEMVKLADKYARGRLISCLEGGYDLPSLGRSAVAHIKQLAEFQS